MSSAFFAKVRELSGGKLSQDQVNHLNRILAASAGLQRSHRAYILATAWHETARFKYLREIWGPTAQQRKYEGRADLGNTQKGDGLRFLGRGYVQITGRRNYTDWSKRLGVDLLAAPVLAEETEHSARILVEGMRLGTFTGKKLSDYLPGDYVNARRIVNGTDKAQLIAGYARVFEAALVASGDAVPALSTPSSTPPGIIARLIAAVLKILGR